MYMVHNDKIKTKIYDNSLLYFIYFKFINRFIKRHKVITSEAPYLTMQRCPNTFPVLIAPTHGGMARLSERPG